MRICADPHVHTIASGHAHSTVLENAAAAIALGHSFVFLTDHAPSIPGAPGELYFHSLCKVLPESCAGLPLVRGCEVNLLNDQGELDLKDETLDRLEWVICSMHAPCIPPRDPDYHTRAWLKAAQNPRIDVIGHLGDQRFFCDYERAVRAFAENGKVVEINSHSFVVRPGSRENCPEIARLCAKYRVPVVVSSDAHFAERVGAFDHALRMLEEIRFPEELVLNADPGRFASFLSKRTGREFPL